MPVYASFDYYDGHPSYLTPGKLYEVHDDDFDPESATGGHFYIAADDGYELVCLWKGCAFLHQRDWTRHGTLAELNIQPGDRVRDGNGYEADIIEVNGEPHIRYPDWDVGAARPARDEPHPYFSVVSRAADASLNDEDMASDCDDTPYIAVASPGYCDVPEHKDYDTRAVPLPDEFVLRRAANGGWVLDDPLADTILAAFTGTDDMLAALPRLLGDAK